MRAGSRGASCLAAVPGLLMWVGLIWLLEDLLR